MRDAPTGQATAPGPDTLGMRGRVLLTGATGFLGQGVLERLLADHPHTHIDVLLRPAADASAAERLSELTHRPAFAPWRARVGDTAAEAILAERVRVISGTLADAPRVLAGHPPYDVVVHAAGDVSFRSPLPDAFATNVDGPRALYAAVCGDDTVRRGVPNPPAGTRPHVVHVSTAYVWADRVSIGTETRVPHHLDWRTEARHAERLAAALVQAAEADRAIEATTARRGSHDRRCSPDRARWVRDRLVEAGLNRARERGWTDAYTYSKALGERVAEERCAAVPLTVLRPTIIESALSRPYPGWLDGFKVTDPMIAAYAKGRLPAFPGAPENVLDIVPVDVVVTAVVAAAQRPPTPGRPRYVHVGTSVSNPLRLEDLRRIAQCYFEQAPWTDRDDRAVRPPPFRFVAPTVMRRRLARLSRWTERMRVVAARLPGRAGARARVRLAAAARRLATVREFAALYEPYSCSQTRYDDAALRALDAGREVGERHRDPLDVAVWSWDDYLGTVHLPAVRRLMAETRRGRSAPTVPARDAAQTVTPAAS